MSSDPSGWSDLTVKPPLVQWNKPALVLAIERHSWPKTFTGFDLWEAANEQLKELLRRKVQAAQNTDPAAQQSTWWKKKKTQKTIYHFWIEPSTEVIFKVAQDPFSFIIFY